MGLGLWASAGRVDAGASAREARTVAGARHALRQALEADDMEGAGRALLVMRERGWGEQALGAGAWETLRSALSSARPERGLRWLRREGLRITFSMAAEALAAALERSEGARWAGAVEELVRGFGAGAEEGAGERWRRLMAQDSALAREAAANWERWELGEACGEAPPGKPGGKRL